MRHLKKPRARNSKDARGAFITDQPPKDYLEIVRKGAELEAAVLGAEEDALEALGVKPADSDPESDKELEKQVILCDYSVGLGDGHSHTISNIYIRNIKLELHDSDYYHYHNSLQYLHSSLLNSFSTTTVDCGPQITRGGCLP